MSQEPRLYYTKKYTAEDFGYEGHENLMNPATGTVRTAEWWASEAHEWEGADHDLSEEEVTEQFFTLIEVIKDKDSDWIEKE